MPAVASSPLPAPVAKPPPPSHLPDLLTGPASILWTWVVPIFILCLLNGVGYRLISDSFDEKNRQIAQFLGALNLGNLAAGVVVYLLTLRRLRLGRLSLGCGELAGVPAMAAQAIYLLLALWLADEVLPRSVRMWLYPETRFIFNQASFAMLPFVAGMVQFACAPSLRSNRAILSGLGCALGVPVVLYFAMHVVGQGASLAKFPVFMLLSGIVLAALLGVVLFVRVVARVSWFRSESPELGCVLVAVFALVLPALGLAMNNAAQIPADFQTWETWALTGLNAAVLFYAVLCPARWPRVTLALVAATFPFSLYFFIAFLPYVPLGVLLVLLLGLGFMLLTPTFLMIVHGRVLARAWSQVAPRHGHRHALGLALACGLILPGFVVARAVGDRSALRAALDHVYAPTVKQGEIAFSPSLVRLRGALANHRAYKNGAYRPLLSDFYSWAVFDNLTLSDEKLARLEQVFFGAPSPAESQYTRGRLGNRQRVRPAIPTPKTVSLTRLDVKAASAGAGDTTVTLAFTLTNTGAWPAEYVTALPLPPGVFVNGFRLHVHGAPVPGRITEKKTALWVYTTIRDFERRDPGLLVYTAPDALELRVFPVEKNTPSIVEIDFLVPAEVSAETWRGLHLDPAAVLRRLGASVRPQRIDTPQGVAVVGLDRLHLPPVAREPYLHLIVDRSLDNPFRGDFALALRDLRRRFPAAHFGRVTLANHNVASLVSPLTPLDELPERMRAYDRAMAPAGGLLLDLALAHGLRQHASQELDVATPSLAPPPRPIFVVLGKTAAVRTLAAPLATAWSDVVPGLEVHDYGDDGTFRTSLAQTSAAAVPLVRAGRSLRPVRGPAPVRFISTPDPIEYWAAVERRWLPVADLRSRSQPGAWGRAMSLLLRQHDAERNPGGAGDDRRSLVLAGRDAGLMTHATSYIVVENAAQWKLLDVGERRKLAQNDALDHVETPAPGWAWLACGFAIWLAVRRWCSRPRAAPAV